MLLLKRLLWICRMQFWQPCQKNLPKSLILFRLRSKKERFYFGEKFPTIFFFKKNTGLQNSTVELKNAVLTTQLEIYCQNVEVLRSNCEIDQKRFSKKFFPSNFFCRQIVHIFDNSAEKILSLGWHCFGQGPKKTSNFFL